VASKKELPAGFDKILSNYVEPFLTPGIFAVSAWQDREIKKQIKHVYKKKNARQVYEDVSFERSDFCFPLSVSTLPTPRLCGGILSFFFSLPASLTAHSTIYRNAII
jgi:hypothetical protein